MINFPDGSVVRIFEEDKVKTTYPPLHTPIFNWGIRLSPDADCSARNEQYGVDKKLNVLSTVLGHETKGGFDTAKLLHKTGDILWLAPSLDCELLGLYSRDAGEGVYSVGWELLEAHLGPPDQSLFATDGYQEVRPSEVAVRLNRRHLEILGAGATEISKVVDRVRSDQQWKYQDANWLARHK